MATIYALLIIKGLKTMSEVPEAIREDAMRILVDMGRGDLAAMPEVGI